jgi:hypothetical protein
MGKPRGGVTKLSDIVCEERESSWADGGSEGEESGPVAGKGRVG